MSLSNCRGGAKLILFYFDKGTNFFSFINWFHFVRTTYEREYISQCRFDTQLLTKKNSTKQMKLVQEWYLSTIADITRALMNLTVSEL